MISKELFSKVEALPIEIISNYEFNIDTVEYFDLDDERVYYTNINDFAFNCKNWAYSKGYHIFAYQTKDHGFEVIVTDNKSYYNMESLDTRSKFHWFNLESEQESIFKACEWILENLKD